MPVKLIFGVGINDAGYVVKVHKELGKKGGKRLREVVWRCPYYVKWESMISRCYSKNFHKRKPSYIGCSVCKDWLTFSNFKDWVNSQPDKNWMGKDLDKDLITGGKVYSPETCVFLPTTLNNFIKDLVNVLSSSQYLKGVSYTSYNRIPRYRAQCKDPFKRCKSHLGMFDTEIAAHEAWVARKIQYGLELSELESDLRVKTALLDMLENLV